MSNNKLDNPAWYSLSESHRDLAIDYGTIKFYDPQFCPFGGFENSVDVSKALEQYASLTDNFFVVGKKPIIPNGLTLKNELVCLQMVADKNVERQGMDIITPLALQHREELFTLVNLVQPGYFRPGTAAMGDYFGIVKDGKLVAVAGERMKMNEFTEVSAIVTHPDHTGRGYAKQLTAHVMNNIFDQNKIPYLHVVEKNVGAINLYEKLGFKTRRRISFWNIIKANC